MAIDNSNFVGIKDYNKLTGANKMRYNDVQDEPPTTRVLLRVEKQRVRVRCSFWIMAYLCNLNWQLKNTREKAAVPN